MEKEVRFKKAYNYISFGFALVTAHSILNWDCFSALSKFLSPVLRFCPPAALIMMVLGTSHLIILGLTDVDLIDSAYPSEKKPKIGEIDELIECLEKRFKEDTEHRRLSFFTDYNGKKLKYISVRMTSLSSKTRQVLHEQIQVPLTDIYYLCKASESALYAYKTHSVYIETLIEDLKAAINECDSELKEKVLIEKLPVLSKIIATIRRDVESGHLYDSDKQRYKSELEAESYHPFAVLENMSILKQRD